eukprot:m.116312 g.116312  ORF g.116312 m.116312 type:complete len:739 (-) comp9303_c0_seq2:1830-4046(-)
MLASSVPPFTLILAVWLFSFSCLAIVVRGEVVPRRTHASLEDVDLAAFDVLIVGAGFTGTVMADIAARVFDKKVLVIDKNDHVGGSCYDLTNRNNAVHGKYGARFFHTKNETAWKYVNRFGDWFGYEARFTLMSNDEQMVPFPVNIDSLSTLLGKKITSREGAIKVLKEVLRSENTFIGDELLSDDKLLKEAEKKLYSRFFKARKWTPYPYEIGSGVKLSERERVPIRLDWDDRMFPKDDFQALPKEGYGAWFDKALDHENIEVVLKADFNTNFTSKEMREGFQHIIYTGPIDRYFESDPRERLRYKTFMYHATPTDYKNGNIGQGAPVLMFPDGPFGAFTRCVDFNILFNTALDSTTVVCESPHDVLGSTRTHDVSLIPAGDKRNLDLFNNVYKGLIEKEERTTNVRFIGGLANYNYMNIDETILNAIEAAANLFSKSQPSLISSLLSKPANLASLAHPLEGFKVNVIIAVYNEPLTWVKQVCQDLREFHTTFIVYAKHSSVTHSLVKNNLGENCNAALHVIHLRNVGREGHTWLHYLLTKEAMFGDVNIFLQGNPEGALEACSYAARSMKQRLFDVNHSTRASHVSNTYINRGYKKFSKASLAMLTEDRQTVRVADHLMHFVSIHGIAYSFNAAAFMAKNQIGATLRGEFCDLFHSFFPYTTREECTHGVKTHGGEFVITDAALRRSIARHRSLLKMAGSAMSHSSEPVFGHYMERMWGSIILGPHNKQTVVEIFN